MAAEQPKRSFNTMFERQESVGTPIELPIHVTPTKQFTQESLPIPASNHMEIVYPSKERSIDIEEKRPSDRNEAILLEIATLSREWDYLDYCELVTSLHIAMIKHEDKKIVDLQIQILKHPLHKEACFVKNQYEFNALGKMSRK